MHIRITPFSIDPARIEAAETISREQVLPVMRALPGFHSYYNGLDRTTGRGVTVTTWETEEQANALRELLRDGVGALQASGITFDPPNIYEVRTHEQAE
jgi:hypothetical protein